MSMYCMYENKVKPTHENIDRYLSGNLCRCTGYNPIKKSIKNMYSYKRNNHDYKKILKLLKGIKKNDIMIENKQSKFYVHHNLKGLIKDYQNKKDSHLLVGGNSEAIRHQLDGIIVPAKHPVEMSMAIRRLFDRSERWRLGENARKRASENFSSQSCWDSYAEIYEGSVSDKKESGFF